jgi:hypothetical protein
MHVPHRQPRPRRRRPAALAALLAIGILVMPAAGTVAGKEGLEVRFDAPIGMDTPPGTIVVVGLRVSVLGDDGPMPVEGTPIYLELVGRDGATSRAAAAGDRTPGRYTATIAIPEGGARAVEVGIHGTSDLPVTVMNEPLVFGPVTPRTAQVATPEQASKAGLAPKPTPQVDPAAVPAGQARPAAAPGARRTGEATPTAGGPGQAALVTTLVLAGLGVLGIALVTRRERAARGGTA